MPANPNFNSSGSTGPEHASSRLGEGPRTAIRKLWAAFASLTRRLNEAESEEQLRLALNFVAAVGLFISLALVAPESWWRDQRFALRDGEPLDSSLVLVGLDEAYAEQFGYPETVPKEYLARLVEALTAYGPRTIALDVLVSPAEPDTAALAAFIRAVTEAERQGVRVVLPARIGGYGASRATGHGLRVVVAPPSPLDTLTHSGYVDYQVTLDPENVPIKDLLSPAPAVRELPLVARLHVRDPSVGRSVAASFPLVAVAAHNRWLPPGAASPATLSDKETAAVFDSLGLSVDPAFVGEQIAPMDYAAPATPVSDRVRYLAAADVLSPFEGELEQVRGRLVLIAAVYPSPDGADVARTPFGNVRGGVVQLHAMDTLLRGQYPLELGPLLTVLIVAGVFAAVLGGWQWAVVPALGWSALILLLYVALAFASFEEGGLFLPIAWPVWAGVLAVAVGFVFHQHLRSRPTQPQPMFPQGGVISGPEERLDDSLPEKYPSRPADARRELPRGTQSWTSNWLIAIALVVLGIWLGRSR